MREYIIGIIPSGMVTRLSIERSRTLRGEGGVYVLNGASERPHVTLYYVPLPDGGIQNARKQLKGLAVKIGPMELRSTEFYTEDGWVGVRYRKTRELAALHRAVVEAINPLRAGTLRDRDVERLSRVDARTRASIVAYGSRFVRTAFRPHLTFTRLSDHGKHVQVQDRVDDFSFLAVKIGLFAAGRHGTCTRLLQSFMLSGSWGHIRDGRIV